MTGEWTGINTEGDICSKNGLKFTIPDGPIADIRELLTEGDIVGYPTGNRYRITFVDVDTVKMVRT